jgi:hypothetical protein
MQVDAPDRITRLLAEDGIDGLNTAITVLLNEMLRIERAKERQGRANGFKPGIITTRAGDLQPSPSPGRGAVSPLGTSCDLL